MTHSLQLLTLFFVCNNYIQTMPYKRCGAVNTCSYMEVILTQVIGRIVVFVENKNESIYQP